MDSPLPLRERYRQELVVRGLAERTVDAYVRAVVQMVDRTGLHPARMSEDDVRAYLASLVETHGCAESTDRQHATGVCHFFDWVLGRSFAVLDAARPRRRRPLPEVLTLGEVQRTIAAIRRSGTACGCGRGLQLRPSAERNGGTADALDRGRRLPLSPTI